MEPATTPATNKRSRMGLQTRLGRLPSAVLRAEPSSWPPSATVLRLARRSDRCTVLGPGTRAVLWVQGCPRCCPGCVALEMLPFRGGTEVSVVALAGELAALEDIEGVTFSGGEPMAQAEALTALIDALRAGRDLSFLSYTGYAREDLEQGGTTAQRALLTRLDMLIDGAYVAELHCDLRWRGSRNQRVHFLTDRYRHLAPAADDRGRWIEFELLPDGSLQWMGIPPPGFSEAFAGALARRGIVLEGDKP